MTEVKKIAPSLIEMAKEVIRLDSAPLNSSWEEFAETACNAAPALAAALLRAEELLEKCADACERSYNVTDWPADGDTEQDHAANEARAFLASLKEPQQ